MSDLNNTVIPIWKPKNIYSNDIVKYIRKKYNVKAGHAGTLDPFAEGVLIICTGSKTKTIEENQSLDKKYLASIALGEETNTLDFSGEIIRRSEVCRLTKAKVKKALKDFEGEIMQRPPAFSALRRNSVRLYRLARKDIYINLKPRPVKVISIKLISFGEKFIDIEVVCGKGTYIRSLARDIALRLNTYGHLTSLKRLSIGPYDKESCHMIDLQFNKS